MKLSGIYPSERKDKRFVAVFESQKDMKIQHIKRVHFGSKYGNTYIDHGNKNLRDNYIKRHYINENWNDAYSPGALSRFILWGNSSNIDKNINDYIDMFSL